MHLFAARQDPPPTATIVASIAAPTPTPTSIINEGPIDAIPTITNTPDSFPTQDVKVSGTHSSSTNNPAVIVIVIVCIAGILAIVGAIVFLRRTRIRHKNPKYIPTPYLKRLWKKWEPKAAHARLPDTNEHLEPISSSRRTGLRVPGRSSVPPTSFDAAARSFVAAAENNTTEGGVDRNTSVRSVMTLPAYHQNAMQNEQVLGREGDRGGIDVVVEFPEGVDEEEARREEEMEALYQVRLARRRENEEREERRRLRREARERGDYVALREIQARARASSGASAGRSVEELRAEHERIKKERQRAVSSVSYADLGVARHDGTRIRANSQDSERTGLLGDAASIAASSHYHRRDRSASSILSIDTTDSALPSPRLTRSRANSRPESPGFSRTQTNDTQNEGRAGSSPEMIEHEDIPPNSPPGYENISLDTPHDEPPHPPLEPPPDYSSPVLARGEHTPMMSSPPTQSTPTPPLAASQFSSHPPNERRESSTSRRESRRTSTHVGQMISSDRRASSSSSAGALRSSHRTAVNDRRESRRVGGTPQLPSLRLTSLPSIQVDPGSPRVGRVEENGLEERDLGEHHYPAE